MHRVDPKKRRAALLRYAAYALTLILTTVTTVVLLYVALGYRLDRESGHVVRSGLLLVDNTPEAAAISINNELKDNASPGRFVISAGSYDLKLTREGYRDWSKRVQIAASGVREVKYPMLIPNKLESLALGTLGHPYLVSQSQDRKLALLHAANQPTLTLLTLDPEKFEPVSLPLSGAVRRENGNPGTFRVIEWALNNKHVLLEQTLPSGLTQLLSMDVTKPAEAINVSSLYGQDAPSDIHYVGGNTGLVYGIKDGTLRRYRLSEKETSPLLENVRSYQPYADDTVLFDRQARSGNSEIGIWKDEAVRVVQTTAGGQAPALLKYASFDDHQYFIVAVPGGDRVIIYRDPLKNSARVKQTPFISLTFANPQKIDFSASSQFLLAQNGKNFVVYDFDDLKQYKGALPFGLAPGSGLSWFSSHHLQAMKADTSVVMMDYDGTNQQELTGTSAGSRLLFSNNYQYLYRFTGSNAQTSFEAVPLLNEPD